MDILLPIGVLLLFLFLLFGQRNNRYRQLDDPVSLRISLPRASVYQGAIEELFNDLRELSYQNPKLLVSFEYRVINHKLFTYLVCERRIISYVSSFLYSRYPDAEIEQIDTEFLPKLEYLQGLEIQISYTVREGEVVESPRFLDIKKLFTILTDKIGEQTVGIQNLISFSQTEKSRTSSNYEITIRVFYEKADPRADLIKQYYLSLINDGYTVKIFPIPLIDNTSCKNKKVRVRGQYVPLEHLNDFLFVPDASLEVPNIDRVLSKKIEPPANLHKQNIDLRYIAATNFRNEEKPFGVSKVDRRRHMYILGKSGSGKSTLLKNLIIGDIFDGEGLCLIDPHGDLIEDIINLVPENRLDDIIYWNVSDTDYPIAVNLLKWDTVTDRSLLADSLLSAFKRYFKDSWGPRLEYLLYNAILTLLHCQNVSLLAIQRLLADRNYRRFLLKQVKDPFLVNFWETEYAELEKNPRLLAEALMPIQNKVGRFISVPIIRNILGQVKNTLDFTDIMNNQKILLVNLSQGKIGEENSALLGAMLVASLFTQATHRANIPIEERNDFHLYVDEFQNLATDTFIKILSEARKYGLSLILANQYLDQLTQELQDGIFGNIGTIINFVVGPKDAARLAKEYTPLVSEEDLINMEKYQIFLKLLIDGSQSKPFTGVTLNPTYTKYDFKKAIVDNTRKLYAAPKTIVEDKLKKWSGQKYNEKGNLI